jgi:hypothetical protein
MHTCRNENSRNPSFLQVAITGKTLILSFIHSITHSLYLWSHMILYNAWHQIWTRVIYSSSIGTAALVGYGLLNYCWIFSAGRFSQSAIASGTSNPKLGGPVIRTLQLPPPGVPHVGNDMSEPQQQKVEIQARNCREFCRKWRLPRHFWVLLHAVNLRHGTDGFTSLRRKARWGSFRPKDPTALNPRTWVPKANTLTPRPPKPLRVIYTGLNNQKINFTLAT